MKDKFRKLHQEKSPPPEAKRAVLEEIRTYEMLSDIVELFTGNFARASLDIFDIPKAARKKSKPENR